MMEDTEMNFDDRVDDFVLGGCSLKGYIEFVTEHNILSKRQIAFFENQIRNIDTETLKYKGDFYWPGVHQWIFRNN